MRRFNQYKNKGLQALREGKNRDARFHLLKAAELLFSMARNSRGRLQELRIKSARKLLEMAKAMDARKPVARGKDREKQKDGGREEEGHAFFSVERPAVRFSDIAGLEEAKEEIRLKMIYPFTFPEKAQKYGIRKGGGILLYGPPGTGKTLMARAVAGEIDASFFTVKPSEIMSKWVGESEQNIQRLFDTARSHNLSIIFIDEIEALLPKRRFSASSVMQRVVPQILAELEGFDSSGKNPLLFLGATNEPWSLDPAVLRPGRFDEKIYIGLPEFEARLQILEIHLKGKPLSGDVDFQELAAFTEGYSGADIRNICLKASSGAFLESVKGSEEGPITMDAMKMIIAATKPSVSKVELERFEKYRNQK